MEHSSPSQELARRLRQLRVAGKLTQKDLGEVLGGDQSLSAATISSWEKHDAPKVPPQDRVLAYAQFFATPKSVEAAAPRLIPVEDFTVEELAEYEALRNELLGLHSLARGMSAEAAAARKSWRFADDGPLTFVCAQLPGAEASPLADPASPNYTELLGFGDLDALVELWGHVRMENPHMDVFYKPAPRVAADDLTGHVVIVGGVGWNDVTRRILDLTDLPVTQVEDPAIKTGDIFVSSIDGNEERHLPIWSPGDPAKLVEDVGLFVRMPNPMNSNRTLTMCNGIHSRGVFGAARSLTDKRLRESNERYLAANFADSEQFGILMRIQVIEGVAMTPDFNNPNAVLHQWPSPPGATSAKATRAQGRR
jgi:transcriptional regulator with XRE-family HTH domain